MKISKQQATRILYRIYAALKEGGTQLQYDLIDVDLGDALDREDALLDRAGLDGYGDPV